jgi:hypothetical protein
MNDIKREIHAIEQDLEMWADWHCKRTKCQHTSCQKRAAAIAILKLQLEEATRRLKWLQYILRRY